MAGHSVAGACRPSCSSGPGYRTGNLKSSVKEQNRPGRHSGRRDACGRDSEFCRGNPAAPCIQRKTRVVPRGRAFDTGPLCASGDLPGALSGGSDLQADGEHAFRGAGETVRAVRTGKRTGTRKDHFYPRPEKRLDPGPELCGTRVRIPAHGKLCCGKYLYDPGTWPRVRELDHEPGLYADPGADRIYGHGGHIGESCDGPCLRLDGSQDAPVIQRTIRKRKRV